MGFCAPFLRLENLKNPELEERQSRQEKLQAIQQSCGARLTQQGTDNVQLSWFGRGMSWLPRIDRCRTQSDG